MIKNTFAKFFDYASVVVAAFLFFQFPLFIQQYKLQLIGHVHELQWQVVSMQERALKTEKTLDQYIQKFIDHADPDFSEQGESMKLVFNRWNTLSNTLFQITHASMFTRPMHFLRTLQWDIFTSTADAFEPGFFLNLESLLYALLGMIAGHSLFLFCASFWKKLFPPKVELPNQAP